MCDWLQLGFCSFSRSGFFLRRLLLLYWLGFGFRCGTIIDRFTLAMDNDLDFRNKVHGQANVSGELAQVADGLHIDLLFLDLKAGLFLDGDSHILRGDGAVELTSLTSFGSKDHGDPVDLVCETLKLGILFCPADFRLRTDLFDLFERTCGGKHSQFLGEQEIAPVTIGDLLYVTCAPQFVNVLEKQYFHDLSPFVTFLWIFARAKGTTLGGVFYHIIRPPSPINVGSSSVPRTIPVDPCRRPRASRCVPLPGLSSGIQRWPAPRRCSVPPA